MVSDYYKAKTATKEFKEEFGTLLNQLCDKKVIIYGRSDEFNYLCENFPLRELNITAFADTGFLKKQSFSDIKLINPKDISGEEYDFILAIGEKPIRIVKQLKKLNINQNAIKPVILNSFEDERKSFLYLKKRNFGINLNKLAEKLKGKTVVIYGAGVFFEAIVKYYDLSCLNIVAVSDRRFTKHDENETFCNYKVLAPEEIADAKPDYVLFATKLYVNMMYSLYGKLFKKTRIKLKALVKKPFWELIKEA